MSCCAVVGCGGPVRVRGMCQKCYLRWWVTQPETRARRAAAQRKRREDEGFRTRQNERQRAYDARRRAPGTEGAERHRAAVRERSRKPEVKKKLRSYMQEYASRPDVRERQRAAQRHKHTGFTDQLTQELRVLQGGKCAICARIMMIGGRSRHAENADHCHTQCVPRGLLCGACNTSLGTYEKHQRPSGLAIDVYEAYLADTPVMRLARATLGVP